MASFYTTADSRGYRLRLDVTQGSQSVENNTSSVTWSLYLVTGNNWYFTRYALSNTLTWVDVDADGTKEWSWPTGEQFSCLGTNKTTLVASGTKTIPHNADGTKTISASASFRTATASTSYGPIATMTVSGSVTLTTIPRASAPTLSSYSLNLGDTVTITTNRASTSFTHNLTYQIGSKTGSIASGIGASDLWTLPNSLADAIPTSTSGTVTITCNTYSGTTLVGTKTVSLTANVPNTATFKPTASISSITEAVTMPSGISVLVQGKSQLKVISTGVSNYPANNISQVKVSVAGANYYGTTITSATIMTSGTVTVSLTVTDKRGYYSTVSQNVTVYAYSPPSISSFTARRSPDDQGTGLYSSYAYAVSAVNNQNTVSWALRYRLAGATAWTNIATATTPYSTAGTRTTPDILNGNLSYEIGFSLTDKWSSTAQAFNVGSVFDLTNYNASGRGIAFGKVSERDAFEVGMPFYANNHLQPLAYAREVTFSTAYVYAFSCSGAYLSSAVRFSVRGTSGNVVVVAMVEIIANHSNAILISGTQGNYTPLTVKAISDGNGSFDVFLKHSGESSTPCFVEVIPVGGAVVSFTPLGASAATKELALRRNGHSTTGGHSIIESGSNTNGIYVRLSDGTQICYRVIDSITGLSIANNTFWTSAAYAFPAAFVGSPIRHISCFVADSAGTPRNAAPIPHYASNWQWFISNITGGTITQLLSISLLAIGRWK